MTYKLNSNLLYFIVPTQDKRSSYTANVFFSVTNQGVYFSDITSLLCFSRKI